MRSNTSGKMAAMYISCYGDEAPGKFAEQMVPVLELTQRSQSTKVQAYADVLPGYKMNRDDAASYAVYLLFEEPQDVSFAVAVAQQLKRKSYVAELLFELERNGVDVALENFVSNAKRDKDRIVRITLAYLNRKIGESSSTT